MTKELTYAQKCGMASRRTGIPFNVCLACSPEFAEELEAAYTRLRKHTDRVGPPLQITLDALRGHNMSKPFKTDLYTMKEALIGLIEPTYEFRIYIEELGFEHTKRIADYLLLLW